jgi:hypothetical protein
MGPVIIPATAELLERFYGAPPKQTMRAFVGVLDGEVLGVVALVADGSRMALFSEMKPEARKYSKAIVRGAREIMALAERIGAPVHAAADTDIPCAERFLTRLGFTRIAPEVFEWLPGSQ